MKKKKKKPNVPKTKNQKKKNSQSFSQTYPFQITKTQIKKLNQTYKRSNKTIENKLHKQIWYGRKHYICKEEHLKSESSLATLENIVTKRREERVKLQKTQHQALD